MAPGWLLDLLHRYGYGFIGLAIGLESMGVPLPGETLLVGAALYSVASGHLEIGWIVTAAALGAVLGDNAGYALGRYLGVPLLARHGGRIGLTPRRLMLGQYLFSRHGAKVVFFGRFTALLRAFAALLAGASGMGWGRFLFWNALGGVVWAGSIGFGAYYLGERILRFAAPVGIAVGVAVVAGAVGIAWTLHKRGLEMEDHAVAVMTARAATAQAATGQAAAAQAATERATTARAEKGGRPAA